MSIFPIVLLSFPTLILFICSMFARLCVSTMAGLMNTFTSGDEDEISPFGVILALDGLVIAYAIVAEIALSSNSILGFIGYCIMIFIGCAVVIGLLGFVFEIAYLIFQFLLSIFLLLFTFLYSCFVKIEQLSTIGFEKCISKISQLTKLGGNTNDKH